MNLGTALFISLIVLLVCANLYAKYKKMKREAIVEAQEKEGIYNPDELVTMTRHEFNESLDIALNEVLSKKGYYRPDEKLTMTIGEYEQAITNHVKKHLKIIEDKIAEKEQALTQQ